MAEGITLAPVHVVRRARRCPGISGAATMAAVLGGHGAEPEPSDARPGPNWNRPTICVPPRPELERFEVAPGQRWRSARNALSRATGLRARGGTLRGRTSELRGSAVGGAGCHCAPSGLHGLRGVALGAKGLHGSEMTLGAKGLHRPRWRGAGRRYAPPGLHGFEVMPGAKHFHAPRGHAVLAAAAHRRGTTRAEVEWARLQRLQSIAALGCPAGCRRSPPGLQGSEVVLGANGRHVPGDGSARAGPALTSRNRARSEVPGGGAVVGPVVEPWWARRWSRSGPGGGAG